MLALFVFVVVVVIIITNKYYCTLPAEMVPLVQFDSLLRQEYKILERPIPNRDTSTILEIHIEAPIELIEEVAERCDGKRGSTNPMLD